eukprot:TRINITY_DN2232_c0_g2_i4.p1 TRINITY_DN2232_c0_g2~~TRINITY_DN2232_c0_g2_i4.p1  ORF type:complete len:646 (-),score=117.63 TRINITY_DN2232_c0_g2_i4:141-2078(-)
MMVAKTLILRFLGSDWKLTDEEMGNSSSQYRKILRMFEDNACAPFSIHHLVEQNNVLHGYSKEVLGHGEWFSPSKLVLTLAHVVNNTFTKEEIKIHVTRYGTIYLEEILSLCWRTSDQKEPFEEQSNLEDNCPPYPEEERLSLLTPISSKSNHLNQTQEETQVQGKRECCESKHVPRRRSLLLPKSLTRRVSENDLGKSINPACMDQVLGGVEQVAGSLQRQTFCSISASLNSRMQQQLSGELRVPGQVGPPFSGSDVELRSGHELGSGLGSKQEGITLSSSFPISFFSSVPNQPPTSISNTKSTPFPNSVSIFRTNSFRSDQRMSIELCDLSSNSGDVQNSEEENESFSKDDDYPNPNPIQHQQLQLQQQNFNPVHRCEDDWGEEIEAKHLLTREELFSPLTWYEKSPILCTFLSSFLDDSLGPKGTMTTAFSVTSNTTTTTTATSTISPTVTPASTVGSATVTATTSKVETTATHSSSIATSTSTPTPLSKEKFISMLKMSEERWKPILLLISTKLGNDKINKIYHPHLKRILSSRYSVGILGGRPGASLYLIGFQEGEVIYLDPHVLQTSREMNELLTPEFLQTYHCRCPQKMQFSEIDPCLVIGIFIKTLEEFLSFVFHEKEFMEIGLPTVFNLEERYSVH